MVKAFVFGKFLPFHNGHKAMIDFALTKCDFLTVLVCCSDKEDIPAAARKKWIETTFDLPSNSLEVRSYNYLESELPNTSVSSKEISKVWSEKFKGLFPDYSLLITSEPYGNYVASFMEIQHIPFDIPKQLYPISATKIKTDLFAYWNFLPDSVKPDFSIKIVILGTESTGKSTLTEKLALHYNCSAIKEAGRDIIADSNSFNFNDLKLVAIEHAQRIKTAMIGVSPLIIIDTDIHITKSYSKFSFEKEFEIDDNIYNSNKASLYLYLNNDVDFIQDGTRMNEKARNLLDKSHRATLKEHDINYVELLGDWEQRFEKALVEIDKLISIKRKTF